MSSRNKNNGRNYSMRFFRSRDIMDVPFQLELTEALATKIEHPVYGRPDMCLNENF